jgi:hypothetical protein
MTFPLSFGDISFTIAVAAAMLLAASALFSIFYGRVNILIDKKKLRYIAIAFSLLFLSTVGLRVAGILMS